jgi:hypothetical protein
MQAENRAHFSSSHTGVSAGRLDLFKPGATTRPMRALSVEYNSIRKMLPIVFTESKRKAVCLERHRDQEDQRSGA